MPYHPELQALWDAKEAAWRDYTSNPTSDACRAFTDAYAAFRDYRKNAVRQQHRDAIYELVRRDLVYGAMEEEACRVLADFFPLPNDSENPEQNQ